MTDETLPLKPETVKAEIVTTGDAGPPAIQPNAPDMNALFVQAVEKGDVGVMEKLVELDERVAKRRAREAFHEAMAAFRAACPKIPKTKSSKDTKDGGTSFSYMYAPLEVITDTIDPICAEHGLSYSFDEEIRDDGRITTLCYPHHRGGYTGMPGRFTCPPDGGSMTAIQKVGSAQTYGMRYSLIKAFALTTCDEDTDGVPPGEGVTISPEDAQSLVVECDKVGMKVERLLKLYGVETIGQLPLVNLPAARMLLEQKGKA